MGDGNYSDLHGTDPRGLQGVYKGSEVAEVWYHLVDSILPDLVVRFHTADSSTVSCQGIISLLKASDTSFLPLPVNISC